eukprot:198585_1
MDLMKSWITSLINYWRRSNVKTKYVTMSVSVGVVASTLIYSQYKKYKLSQKIGALHARGAIKRAELVNKEHKCFKQFNKIPQNEITQNLVKMSGMEIRENIIKGNIDCKTVILIFSHHAHTINTSLKLNCILEEHYDTAYKRADELDKMISHYRNESKESFQQFIESKPLLGIPMSLKDHYIMKHSDCTCGTLAHCNNKYDSDGEMVQLIKHFGAIPFVKTNCAQLNAVYETWNHIIGDTLHYLNPKRVVGGSSGGEGALIGAGGSVLGLGSDIGGSIRCPADWCGVISYKPSSSRCLQLGSNGPHGGYSSNSTIMPSFGPLARNMCDIVQFLKVYWSSYAFQMDPYMTQMTFRDNRYKSVDTLSVGYWYHDGWFMASKAQRRAIDLSVDGLHKNGSYDIVKIDDFDLGFEAFALYLASMSKQSGMRHFIRALQGEPLYKGYQTAASFTQIPDWIKHKIMAPLMIKFGELRMAQVTKLSMKYDQTAQQIEQVIWEIQQFRYKFWKIMKGKYKIDLVITAVMPYPAPTIGFLEDVYPSTSFCTLQNVLDSATGSYSPVCYVNKDECDYLNDPMLPSDHKDSYSKAIDTYLKGSEGLPVGVQVFGQPFEDERVLRVMADLEKALRK